MLLAILKVVLLLVAIIEPLVPRRSKFKSVKKYKINKDTYNAHYAINEHGLLEEIGKPTLTHH